MMTKPVLRTQTLTVTVYCSDVDDDHEPNDHEPNDHEDDGNDGGDHLGPSSQESDCKSFAKSLSRARDDRQLALYQADHHDSLVVKILEKKGTMDKKRTQAQNRCFSP